MICYKRELKSSKQKSKNRQEESSTNVEPRTDALIGRRSEENANGSYRL